LQKYICIRRHHPNKILRTFALNFSKNYEWFEKPHQKFESVSSVIQMPQSRWVFQPTFQCLDILMKHPFSCFIYYIILCKEILHDFTLKWIQTKKQKQKQKKPNESLFRMLELRMFVKAVYFILWLCFCQGMFQGQTLGN